MKITLIAAMTQDHVIGINNQLPWHLPADFKHFKQTTLGKPVVMGRKTFVSLGRPLPNRLNIILSRDPNLAIPGCIVVNSLEAVLKHPKLIGCEELMIIGGSHVYEQWLAHATHMILTRVHADCIGDAFFPKWDTEKWQETRRQHYAADDKHAHAFDIVYYEKRVETNV